MEVKTAPSVINQVETEYNRRVASCLQEEWNHKSFEPAARRFAVGQVLHEAFLQKVEPWEEQTPIQIAEFFKGVAPQELELWVKDAIFFLDLHKLNRRYMSILFAARRALNLKENGRGK